jgi:hypothetical protein
MTTESLAHVVSNKLSVRGSVGSVSSSFVAANPVADTQAQVFSGADVESAFDRVSQPAGRGKLSHVQTSSETFAARKQEEIELEEHSR